MESKQRQTVAREAGTVRSWNVLVRHTTFLVKQRDIEAATEAEAKAKFLKIVEEKHREIANKQSGPEKIKQAEKVMLAYQRGVELVTAKPETFIVRPTDEVKAERDTIKNDRAKVWGTAESKK